MRSVVIGDCTKTKIHYIHHILTTHAVDRYRHVQNALYVDHTRTPPTIHANHADSKSDRDTESLTDHQLTTKFQRFSIKPLAGGCEDD
jgi:hypothetical protein